MSAAAFVLAASRINHGLIDSRLPAGPGLTLDESFNVGQGVYLAEAIGRHGPMILTPTVAKEVFAARDYLSDHPPVGRILLGMAHQMTAWLIGGADGCSINITAARTGSCFAFAVLIFLVFEFCRRHFDQPTATAAAVALIFMPQFIGHARLATLETSTVLAWSAAVLAFASWWTGTTPPTNRQAIFCGALWGGLMLTKMQGILLPPLIAGWSLYHLRIRAIRPLLLWTLSGLFVAFVCWPWLWLDPMEHIRQYLGRASDRQTLYVWYLGERFADKLVPWHFPFVMTLITVPVYALLSLVMRAMNRQMQTIEWFLLAATLWPLIVFALPGTPVYDGTRLFLCIMPSLAILAARGFALSIRRIREARLHPETVPVGRWLPACLLITVIALAKTTADRSWLSPYAINEYNDLVGRGRGAWRLGMESCYWSDSLNGDFWKHIAEDTTIFVAPVSHQFQLNAIESLVPVVARKNIHLVPFEYDSQRQRGPLLLLHRLADLRRSLREVPPSAELLIEVQYDGVVLARLIDTTHAEWDELPE
ncbi:MAG: glycosyltransferase family 39 protein [Planctomycetaceae bacterium]|nr:glycosyltransferase family 39 protein [Planctomycetaceae bacterium]